MSLINWNCLAQSNYSVSHYNTDNGLPQNSVSAIKFDRAGYCWLATEMGLVRFDGRTFHTYSSSDSPAVRSDRIKSLVCDRNGNIYGTTDKKDHFIIGAPSGKKAPYPAKLEKITHNTLLTGYLQPNAFVDSLDRLLTKHKKKPFVPETISLANGEIYLSHQEKLFYINRKAAIPLPDQKEHFRNRQWAIIGKEYCLTISQTGNVQVWKNGRLQADMTKIYGDLDPGWDDRAGEFKLVWCEQGTYLYIEKKLYRVDIKKGQLHAEKLFDNLDIVGLTSIWYAPAQRKYYLGSQTRGLYIVEPSSFTYPAVPKEVKIQNFYPQVKIAEDQIFTRDIFFSRSKDPAYAPLASMDAMVLYKTPDDQIYFEKDYTFSRYDLNKKKIHPLFVLSNRLRSILPHADGLLFCTERSVGIFSNDSVKMIQDFPDQLNLFSALKLDDDTLLLATGSGLKWYHFNQNKVHRSILDSLTIRNVYRDAGNRLWISTYGRGFYLYEHGQVFSFPLGPKQSLKTVHAFIDDGLGYFWLPSNNGLFKVNQQHLLDYAHGKTKDIYCYMFTNKNGLRTNEFNGSCQFPFVWFRDRMLSISSIDGLVWFYPDKINIVYPDKEIYLDKVLVGTTPVAYAFKKPVVLKPDFGTMTVFVSSPYFGNSENMQLEYRIEGLHDHWQVLPGDGSIKISHAPPGDNKIIIRRMSFSGTAKYKTLELPFTVKPWFYTTWWFYLTVILTVFLAAYLIYWLRLRSLTEKSKLMETLVEARTMELNKVVEQLARSESALINSTEIKDKIITIVLHDLRSPISFLNTISNYLAKNSSLLDKAMLENKLHALHAGTLALVTYTEQFFAWATTQHKDFTITATSFNISDIFKEITLLYADILKSRGNNLFIHETGLTCHTDYQILAIILRNLIDNANKNTSNGQIVLKADRNGDLITISVADSGKGLNPEQIRSFMDENSGINKSGLGSVLILNMLKKINGTLSIKTSSDSGSTFNITLHQHFQPCNAEPDY